MSSSGRLFCPVREFVGWQVPVNLFLSDDLFLRDEDEGGAVTTDTDTESEGVGRLDS